MSTEEFVQRLQSLVDLGDNLSTIVFFAMKTPNGIVLKKANIIGEVLVDIARGYKDSLVAELDKFRHNDKMCVKNLSDRDERSEVIYRYDIPDEEPSFFSIMREPLSIPRKDYNGAKMFDFNTDSFKSIDYFIILLGTEENRIVIYRNNFTINLMQQGRGRYYLNKSGTQISKVNDDILRMDSQIDCMLIDDDFYIVNLKNIDNSNDFATIVRKRANEAVELVADLPFVDNVNGLREHLADLPFARRLMRAMDNSPVTSLPPNDVLEFVKNHQKLSKVLHVKGDKLDLTSRRAQSAFVSLLNDDFLYSKLTKKEYESTSKDPLKNL